MELLLEGWTRLHIPSSKASRQPKVMLAWWLQQQAACQAMDLLLEGRIQLHIPSSTVSHQPQVVLENAPVSRLSKWAAAALRASSPLASNSPTEHQHQPPMLVLQQLERLMVKPP